MIQLNFAYIYIYEDETFISWEQQAGAKIKENWAGGAYEGPAHKGRAHKGPARPNKGPAHEGPGSP